MFVIDRIELTPFHQPQEMRDFNRDNSARLQQQFQSANEIIEVGNMCQNIVRNDKIRLLSAGAKLLCNPGAKKLRQGGYSLFLCDLGDVSRWLQPEHRNSLNLEILQQIPVVARYLNNQALWAQIKSFCHLLHILPSVVQPRDGVRRKVRVIAKNVFGPLELLQLH